MMRARKMCLLAAMSLPLASSLAQKDHSLFVQLTIKHNGKEEPAPSYLTFTAGGQSVRVTVTGGRFAVPSDLRLSPNVALSAIVDGEQINIPEINGEKLTQETWTLLLADKRYDDEFQWAVPKGVDIRRSCILAFESVSTDPGTFQFNPHCRLTLQDERMAPTRSATPDDPPCFSIRVRLNGKPVSGPHTIVLRTDKTEGAASLEGSCFKVPSAVLTQKAVDVYFTVPGNKIRLLAISPSFFTSSWDIDLADRKFDSDVSLPTHARIREACAVIFHGGEPENTLTETRCRTALPWKRTTTDERR